MGFSIRYQHFSGLRRELHSTGSASVSLRSPSDSAAARCARSDLVSPPLSSPGHRRFAPLPSARFPASASSTSLRLLAFDLELVIDTGDHPCFSASVSMLQIRFICLQAFDGGLNAGMFGFTLERQEVPSPSSRGRVLVMMLMSDNHPMLEFPAFRWGVSRL